MVQIRGEMGDTAPAFLGRATAQVKGISRLGGFLTVEKRPSPMAAPTVSWGRGEREEEKEVGLEGRSDGCRGVLRVETKFHDFFSSPD